MSSIFQSSYRGWPDRNARGVNRSFEFDSCHSNHGQFQSQESSLKPYHQQPGNMFKPIDYEVDEDKGNQYFYQHNRLDSRSSSFDHTDTEWSQSNLDSRGSSPDFTFSSFGSHSQFQHRNGISHSHVPQNHHHNHHHHHPSQFQHLQFQHHVQHSAHAHQQQHHRPRDNHLQHNHPNANCFIPDGPFSNNMSFVLQPNPPTRPPAPPVLTAKENSMAMNKFRQLPCRTFISTGSCPYGEKCVFLHDPRVGAKCIAVKCKRKSKEDICADSCFWPTMTREEVSVKLDYKNLPHISQHYVVPHPSSVKVDDGKASGANVLDEKLPSSMSVGEMTGVEEGVYDPTKDARHVAVVYSLWSHFLDVCSCSYESSALKGNTNVALYDPTYPYNCHTNGRRLPNFISLSLGKSLEHRNEELSIFPVVSRSSPSEMIAATASSSTSIASPASLPSNTESTKIALVSTCDFEYNPDSMGSIVDMCETFSSGANEESKPCSTQCDSLVNNDVDANPVTNSSFYESWESAFAAPAEQVAKSIFTFLFPVAIQHYLNLVLKRARAPLSQSLVC